MTQDITIWPTKKAKSRISGSPKLPILSKIIHELKTPVHGIKGILNYLLENWESLADAEKKKHIATVLEAGDSLNDLLNSLLVSSSTKDQLKFSFEKINLVEVVKATVDKYKNLNFTKNKITIGFETEQKECYVKGDKFWISQVLVNLITNAVNYSRGGSVTVSATIEKLDDIDACIISVKDEGIGIAAEDLNRIFTPFYRGSNGAKVEGSGIGLAICREIVEAHGGIISAFSNTDIGSTVKFFIPIT